MPAIEQGEQAHSDVPCIECGAAYPDRHYWNCSWNGMALVPIEDVSATSRDARIAALEAERDVYRDALTLISRGVWTARNSVESIVWGARDALKKGAALAGSREQAAPISDSSESSRLSE